MLRFRTPGLSGMMLLLCPVLSSAAGTLTAYDCWSNLGFEENPPVNISHWSANGTAVSYVNDAVQARTGHGALKIAGTGPVSVWGTRVAGTVLPQAGQTIGGFFWIKLLAAPAAGSSVDVRATGYVGGAETVYTHTEAINLSSVPLNTWTKVDLASAGNTFLEGGSTSFNIVSAGGVNCLIDDVTFGSLATTSEPPPPPVPTVDSAIAPPFSEYVGSVFNGDFETGNVPAGNAYYWGQFVPNQSAVAGSPNMMKLVAAAGTAPGSTKSGVNMVSITRGGLAWNIADLSSSPADRLPRVGDLVGGSYWIYVPAGADLSAGVPAVYFIYQRPGGDVTVADTAAVPASSLVRGAWNFVPIYPKAGATIDSAAIRPAIMISSPQLDGATNPLYPEPYYIDRIRVGRIPPGLFFSAASRLVDASGNAIAAPAPADAEIRAETRIQNSADDSPRDAVLLLKLHEGDALVRSVAKPVTIAARGGLGVSNTAASISAPLEGLDRARLNVRLHLLPDPASGPEMASPFTLLQQTRVVAHTDPAIRYVGRWVTEGSGRRGNWIRPYFRLTFSRSTSVALNLLQSTSLSVVLDGVRTNYNTVSGLVTLGSNLSASETHTLTVSGLIWKDSVFFDGLRLDDTAVLRDSALRNDHIEFIGDSITAWDNGYSWLVPASLDTESSRIAYPGIALHDGFGYYQATPPLYGMESAYFKNSLPGYGSAGDWNFAASPYAPNIVVINLGTNDFSAIQSNPSLVAAFQNSFQALIQNVRAKLAGARIFVLRPFTISAANVQTAIQNATQAVINAGDARVHYVDTSAWNVEIIPGDGIHPTDAGHVTIKDRLVTLLAPYLTGGVKPQTPGITSADQATFVQGQATAFIVTTTGSPAPTLTADGLPAWATLDPATGALTGTPDRAGRHLVTLRASNGVGPAAIQTFALTVAATYSQWAAGYFNSAELITPSISGASATPHGDGVPNLMKYAFDIDPAAPISAPDRAILPQGALKRISGHSYLTLTYLESQIASGLRCQLQSSAALATWRDQLPEITNYLMVDGDRLVEAGVKLDGVSPRFLRLRLTVP